MTWRSWGVGVFLLSGVLRLGAQIPGGRTLDVRVVDAVYCPEANRIYASLSSNSPQYPQSIVEINPDDLSILRSAPLPTVAQLLAITDDGQYLYAVTQVSASTVYVIDTSTMSMDTYHPVIDDSTPLDWQRIAALAPMPGQPHSFVAALTDQFGNGQGLAAFDGTERRPKTINDPFRGSIYGIVSTSEPDLVYAYSGINVNRVRIASDGLAFEGDPFNRMAQSGVKTLQFFNGLVYAPDGSVSNVEARTFDGWFRGDETSIASAFAIDKEHGLIYFAARYDYGTSYFAYDLNTFLPVSWLRFENVPPGDFTMPGFPRRLLLTSGGDLVTFDAGANSRLLFMPVAALPTYAEWSLPSAAEQVTPYLRRLAIPASFLTADPASRKLLATIQGGVPGSGNSLVTIDPASGTVVSRVFVGSEPGRPAPSSGGLYTYVPLFGEGALRRVRTIDGRPEAMVRLTSPPGNRGTGARPVQAAQILPLPGSGDAYAIIQGDIARSNWLGFNSVVVYDGDVRRPLTVNTDQTHMNSGDLSPSGAWLFGLNGGDTGFEFSRVAISSDGAVLDKRAPYLAHSFYETLKCDDTLCVTTGGVVIDGNAGARTAYLGEEGPVIPDRGAGRIYLLSGSARNIEFREYDANTAHLLRMATLPVPGPAYDFCRWSNGEFAALTDEGILLFSADVLAPLPPFPPPQTVSNRSARQLGLNTAGAVFDAQRKLIYASVPGAGDAYPNEIVAIDPVSGNVVKDLPVGSDPSLLRITDDGQYLYAALVTGNAVAKIDLKQWRRDAVYPLAGSPYVLELRPGHSDTFFAAVNSGPRIGIGTGPTGPPGLWMYQGGVQLPLNSPAAITFALALDVNTVLTDDARLSVTASGLSVDQKLSDRLLAGKGQWVARGLVFSTSGSIGDLSRLRLKEQLDEYGAPFPDPDHGRIYYLRTDGIRVYDWNTLQMVGFLPIRIGDSLSANADIFTCGDDCIAVAANGALFLTAPGSIQWNLQLTRPVDRSTDGVQRIAIRSAAMLYDTQRQRLYVATPPEEGGLGNSVVAIDPSSGNIVNTILAATAPSALAISDDGTRLYAGLRGSRAIARIDLNNNQVVERISLPLIYPGDDYWPMGIAVLPGHNDVLGVSAYNGIWYGWRQMILDPGGRMRPYWVGETFKYALGSAIFFVADGSRLQGFDVNTLGSGGGRWSLPVAPNGLQYSPPTGVGVERNVSVCGGAVFTASGGIFDVNTLAQLGSVTMPETGVLGTADQAVACDAGKDRLYYWRHYRQAGSPERTVLDSFTLSTREFVGSRDLPTRDGVVKQMVAVGDARVAYWMTTNPGLPFTGSTPDELFIVNTP